MMKYWPQFKNMFTNLSYFAFPYVQQCQINQRLLFIDYTRKRNIFYTFRLNYNTITI